MNKGRSQSDITPTTAKVLQFIRSYYRTHNYPPAIRDIAYGCSLSSTSVAKYHVQKLADIEIISYTPGAARTIVLHETACRHTGKHERVEVCSDCGRIIREEQHV